MKVTAEARYLLRFDDLCPTMDRVRWGWFAELIQEYGLRPILAVVPENCDPELMCGESDAGFWDEMRALEAAGATIGLHGFRHVCTAEGRSLVPLQHWSEFAGVGYELQREWIGAGLTVLREHGLTPRVWVAPRHGFDGVTCRALRELGLELISDGLARRPFREHGLTWIPQQIWGPVEKQDGLWTICLHANTAAEQEVERLRDFLEHWHGQFTCVEQVLAEWPVRERSQGDQWFHWKTMLRIEMGRLRRG